MFSAIAMAKREESRRILFGGGQWRGGGLRGDRPVVGIAPGEIRHLLIELAAGPPRDPITEDGAGQMIRLMLEATGEQTGPRQLDVVAEGILATTDRLVGAWNAGIAPRP